MLFHGLVELSMGDVHALKIFLSFDDHRHRQHIDAQFLCLLLQDAAVCVGGDGCFHVYTPLCLLACN